MFLQTVATVLANIFFIVLPPLLLLINIWALAGFSLSFSIIFGLILESVGLAFSVAWVLTTWNVSDSQDFGSAIIGTIVLWIIGTIAVFICINDIPTLTRRRRRPRLGR